MISVLTLRYYPAVGGVETTVLEITSRLARYFDMKVITSDLKVERPFQKLSAGELVTEHEGVPISRLESRKFLPVEGYGVIMKGTSEFLKGSDLIHVHSYGTHHADKAVKMANKMNIPVIITAYLHPAAYSHHKLLRTIYDSSVGKRTMQNCTFIISLTNNERNYIANRFNISKDKIVTIPSGIDLNTYRDLGYEREENTLLFVGRLSPVKRLDMLLMALEKVKKRVPDVKLKIIGRDWGEKSRLLEMTKKLKLTDNVEFIGEVAFEDLVEHYNRARIFVLTSRFETFGVTIMEAMGCGMPVVAVGVGGVPEVVGNAGIVCKENAESVSEGILKMLTDNDKYMKMKENTKIRRELYDWENITRQVKTLYENVLEKR
jgi:glycosyltransferase involved in cell wall biosynthesis